RPDMDSLQASGRIHARDRHVVHPAVTAPELQAGIHDATLHVGKPDLAARAITVRESTLAVLPYEVLQIRARDVDVALRLRKPELRVLEIDYPLAEYPAFAYVVQRHLKRRLRRTIRPGADLKPIGRDVAMDDARRAPFLAHQVLHGHSHVLEEDLAGVASG